MERIELEKQYLESVKAIISREREEIQKALERIPLEYKGRYAQVKWGDEDLVKHLCDLQLKRLGMIEGLEQNPYFGSFDFETEQETRFHIGKTDVLNGADLLVLDWRNPICTLYYDQSTGEVSYTAPSGIISGRLNKKTQIRIKDGQIIDIKDVDLVTDDELLAPYLEVNADNKMKTIIASIQSEQNAIIRRPATENLIIQGVAGSGKTSVALHRIAFLLYSLGKDFDVKTFAVLGPNKYFLNYISKVLPDLDTNGISEFTFEEIARRVINDNKLNFESLNDELSKYISDKKRNVASFDLKGTLAYKDAIDQFIKTYFEQTIKGGIEINGITLISEEDLRTSITPGYGNIRSINQVIKNISDKIKSHFDDIYYPLVRPLMEEMKNYPLRSPERLEVIARMDEIKEVVSKGASKELKEKLKPLLLSPIELYKQFLNQMEHYFPLNEEEAERYVTSSYSALRKKIVRCEDRAALMYLSLCQNGSKDLPKISYMVIDEAQDYSMFELYVLREAFNKPVFSIFGDIAQAIYPYRSIENWNEVNKALFGNQASVLIMDRSYRTTQEITLEANGVLKALQLTEATPVIRRGEEVTVMPSSDVENYYMTLLCDYAKKGYQSLGIICKNQSEVEEVSTILDRLEVKYNKITGNDKEYNGDISILTSYLAKGLEFDEVIIHDASEKKYNTKLDMHLLYVALTRAIHELHVLYSGELASVLRKDKTSNIDENLQAKLS